jgi:hypothetical protein
MADDWWKPKTPPKKNPGSVNGMPLAVYNDMVNKNRVTAARNVMQNRMIREQGGYRGSKPKRSVPKSERSIGSASSTKKKTLMPVPRSERSIGSASSFVSPLGVTPNLNTASPGNPGGTDPFAGIQDLVNQQSAPAAPYIDPNLLARVQGMAVSDKALYDAAGERIKENYARSSRDMMDPVSATLSNLQAGAEKMGTAQGWKSDENIRAYDANARNLQETNDLNLNTDLSTVEKLGGMSGEAFAQLARAIQNGYNPFDDGSGAGGSSSGNSSSANDAIMSMLISQMMTGTDTDTAKEDILQRNPGLADAIANIKNPNARAAIDLAYSAAGQDPDKALSNAATQRMKSLGTSSAIKLPKKTTLTGSFWDKLPQLFKRSASYGRNAQTKKAADDDAMNQMEIMNFLRNWSTGYSPQITQRAVNATGKQENKFQSTRKGSVKS